MARFEEDLVLALGRLPSRIDSLTLGLKPNPKRGEKNDVPCFETNPVFHLLTKKIIHDKERRELNLDSGKVIFIMSK